MAKSEKKKAGVYFRCSLSSTFSGSRSFEEISSATFEQANLIHGKKGTHFNHVILFHANSLPAATTDFGKIRKLIFPCSQSND